MRTSKENKERQKWPIKDVGKCGQQERRGEKLEQKKRCSEVPRPATGSAVTMINGSYPTLHPLLFLSFYNVLLMTPNFFPHFHFLWLSHSLINLSAVGSRCGIRDPRNEENLWWNNMNIWIEYCFNIQNANWWGFSMHQDLVHVA